MLFTYFSKRNIGKPKVFPGSGGTQPGELCRHQLLPCREVSFLLSICRRKGGESSTKHSRRIAHVDGPTMNRDSANQRPQYVKLWTMELLPPEMLTQPAFNNSGAKWRRQN